MNDINREHRRYVISFVLTTALGILVVWIILWIRSMP
jgi:hypothetical protein